MPVLGESEEMPYISGPGQQPVPAAPSPSANGPQGPDADLPVVFLGCKRFCWGRQRQSEPPPGLSEGSSHQDLPGFSVSSHDCPVDPSPLCQGDLSQTNRSKPATPVTLLAHLLYFPNVLATVCYLAISLLRYCLSPLSLIVSHIPARALSHLRRCGARPGMVAGTLEMSKSVCEYMTEHKSGHLGGGCF